MKLLQKASFGPETCEIEPTSLVSGVWFLSPEAAEPSGRFRGKPGGPGAVTALQEVVEEPSRHT